MSENNALGKGLDALIQKPKTKKNNSKEKIVEKTVSEDTTLKLSKDKIELIKKEVTKNPRISLWSAKSAAVLKYLKKTEPEFSISNEASTIIDTAISKKYPEIWKEFKDL